jgi:hypothetical protein
MTDGLRANEQCMYQMGKSSHFPVFRCPSSSPMTNSGHDMLRKPTALSAIARRSDGYVPSEVGVNSCSPVTTRMGRDGRTAAIQIMPSFDRIDRSD